MKWLQLIALMFAALFSPQYLFIQSELDEQWRQMIARQLAPVPA